MPSSNDLHRFRSKLSTRDIKSLCESTTQLTRVGEVAATIPKPLTSSFREQVPLGPGPLDCTLIDIDFSLTVRTVDKGVTQVHFSVKPRVTGKKQPQLKIMRTKL